MVRTKSARKRPEPESESDSESEGSSSSGDTSAPEIVWVGKPIRRKAGCKYYSKFKIETTTFTSDMCVKVKAEEYEAVDYYVARLGDVWEDKGGNKWGSFAWFYRPEDTHCGRRPEHKDNELFSSLHIDKNTLESIMGPAQVSAVESTGKDVFFCNKTYDTNLKKFTALKKAATGRTPRFRADSLSDSQASSDESLSEDSSEEFDEDEEPKKRRSRGQKRKSVQKPKSLVVTSDKKQKRRRLGGGQLKTLTDVPAVRNPEDMGQVYTRLDVFGKARAQLQLSAAPEKLPCRESERADIESFIRDAIKSKGKGSSMYISGVPGTGKTATVHEVVRRLQKDSAKKKLPPFHFVEVNGMKLPDPQQVYTLIWEGLTGKRATPSHAVELLEERFNSPGHRRSYCVLLVDELDYLITRKQEVIYNIFDWPSRRDAHLIVVAIANTMNLPEKLLPRVASRLGVKRVTFNPYSKDQVETILRSRIETLNCFDLQGLALCARKIANTSGDIRRALEVCRVACEIAEDDARSEPDKEKIKLVSIAQVNRASQELNNSLNVDIIASFADHERIFLCAVVEQIRVAGMPEVLFEDVAFRHIGYCRANGVAPLANSELKRISYGLGDMRLLSLEAPAIRAAQRSHRIFLQVETDDIIHALKEDPIAQKIIRHA